MSSNAKENSLCVCGILLRYVMEAHVMEQLNLNLFQCYFDFKPIEICAWMRNGMNDETKFNLLQPYLFLNLNLISNDDDDDKMRCKQGDNGMK